VTVDDLKSELSASAERAAQKMKKQSDFDRFIKDIKAEGHLTAIFAELLKLHPDSGPWNALAADVQTQSLELAQAAEGKGAKNYRSAQTALRKMQDMLKKGPKEAADSDPAASSAGDWTTLGELSHVMKRVDPAYKFIRGKMSKKESFEKEAEKIRHEAAILATLSDIAPAFRPDEKDFVNLSAALTAAARDELDSAQRGDFQKASAANTAINDACNKCHAVYRLDQSGKSGLDF
jgi:hypothetical protein